MALAVTTTLRLAALAAIRPVRLLRVRCFSAENGQSPEQPTNTQVDSNEQKRNYNRVAGYKDFQSKITELFEKPADPESYTFAKLLRNSKFVQVCTLDGAQILIQLIETACLHFPSSWEIPRGK